MNQLFVSPSAQIETYCLLVVLASLAGGWILLAVRLTHLRLQIASSFVAGLMLAMALLHFIPHATHQNHSIDQTVRFVLAGFLVMFLLQRFLPHHHHDVGFRRARPAADAGNSLSGHGLAAFWIMVAHDPPGGGTVRAGRGARPVRKPAGIYSRFPRNQAVGENHFREPR